MSMSLFGIHQELADLIEAREIMSLVEGADGSPELVKIDDQIAGWLDKKDGKVESYAGLLRYKEHRALACDREIERLQHIAKQERADIERLKTNAIRVMQTFNVRVIEGETAKLTLCGNGGIQPLDVAVADLPTEFQLAMIRMPVKMWHRIAQDLSEVECREVRTMSIDCDQEHIRAALAQRVKCENCNGAGEITMPVMIDSTEGELTPTQCQRCEGRGTIPNTVPGARLLPRGVHLRVS